MKVSLPEEGDSEPGMGHAPLAFLEALLRAFEGRNRAENEQCSSHFQIRQKTRPATSHTYDVPGKYQVLVKVVDILGNDTNKLLEVKI